ncbi:SMP-30/gluconolactonase/LRE family protein [Paraburkholderia sp. UYCP14C]|uniref:SMP-30/gluconolactonase/LRE family protein n=1 Tax=Paraburkholderia sp. UYCP14C TaxID=2511130 RepID=UPI00101F68F6|nr:SMP-30/gluconolactonase/LRE family protein [Paraburkholderia sp. UYCP14C]RZF25417.1 SMP-30/gluconolactonase/LRE family protein [Paraburkholderia sp. UYCP14C]
MQAAALRTRIIPLPGQAPEDVVTDREGHLIVGVNDGRILRVDPQSGKVQTLANTGGRPLGLEVLPDGHILICDSPKGLLELDPVTGTLKTLVQEYAGRPLPFCSNVVAAEDGTIYFSSSTDRYTVHEWRKDIVENIPTGRLFRRHAAGHIEQLLGELFFANGLALAHDASWIVVAETGAYRLRRVWLKGPKAGRSEIFAELPAFPDNCSMSADGLVWVALASPRNPAVDRLHKLPLPIRKLAARLPAALQPAPKRITWAMAFDAEGRVVHDCQWTDAEYGMVTGVCQHGSSVYLSSLVEQSIFTFELPSD